MKTIWITGASGYLGGAFIREWKTHYPRVELVLLSRKTLGLPTGFKVVTPVNADAGFTLSELEALRTTNPPDGIIHFATHFMNAYQPADAERMLEANVGFPLKILESCRHFKDLWFLNFGSFYSHADGTADGPLTYYAATKRSLETFLKFYSENYSWNAITLKIYDTYGPEDSRPKLIPKLLEVMESGVSMDLSPGEQQLSLVHVDDIVSAAYRAIELLEHAAAKEDPATHAIYQLPAAVESKDFPTLKEVIATLEKAAGKKLNVRFGALPYRAREIMHPSLSFPVLPGWKPKVSLLEGFRSLLD